ncbi:MAG: TatD DNase family protein [Glaciecola sp.]|jgi:TatD DNase family protein
MIDSHCHIDLEVFDSDRDSVLKNALEAGVKRLLLLGLSNRQFTKLLALKQRYEQIDIALGLHPYFLKLQDESQTQIMLNEFSHLASVYQNQYIAFGETGLDSSLALDMAYQKEILRFQLNLASIYNKPVILHHRKSHNHLIRLLKEQKYQGGGILHAFSGSYHEAKTYIDMGFLLGVGGTITYSRASKTRDTIAKLPLDKLVLETDSPDMPLSGFQGQRNQPSQLRLVADTLAQLKKISSQEVEQQTTLNYLTLFGLSLN